jgi:hypothetical protein
MRLSLWLAVLSLVVAFTGDLLAIEAVRGKEYRLSKQHGPWMIMVASFRDVPPDRHQPGLTAAQAAEELVLELRQLGIPAYIHSQDAKVEKIPTRDRMGREDERIYAAQRDMLSVIAGNYDTIDDKTAQKTLASIKKFHPKFMKDKQNGAVYRETPGRKGPLSGAFMTINPMLSPEDVAANERDPVIHRLNSGIDNSLWELKKKYTLRVATFAGKSVTPVGTSAYRNNENQFDEILGRGRNLNDAGEDAAQLARFLRAKGHEAYVYHDHFQSIVTVGGFDTLNDPRITAMSKQFGAKLKPVADGQQETWQPETLTLAGKNPADAPLHVWVLDPKPVLLASDRKPEAKSGFFAKGSYPRFTVVPNQQ